jgi:hypothetical protein
MHVDVTEGRLVFPEALNLSKSGWFGTFNYTISNVLDSSDVEILYPNKCGVIMKSLFFIVLIFTVPQMLLLAQYEPLLYQDEQYCEDMHALNVTPLPPLKADMPFDVIVGYTVIDTLCRLYNASQIESLVHGLSYDSLIIGMKTYIAMRNYDAFLYEHLCQQTFFNPPPNYKTSYRRVQDALLKEYYERTSEITFYDTLRERYDGGIYDVYVVGRSSYYDSSGTKSAKTEAAGVYCADVNILSSVYEYGTHVTCGSEVGDESNGCIRISWYTPDDSYFLGRGYSTQETYEQTAGRLEPGYEYLVFLIIWGSGPSTYQHHLYLAFKVLNGSLHDPDGFFRMGEYIDKNSLISILHSKINLYN